MKLLKSFFKHPFQTGTLTPSSKGLVKRMTEWIDWDDATNIIEYGPGTGAFTRVIQEKMQQDANFFAIEFNPKLVEYLEEKFPNLKFIEESVANVKEVCESQGMESVDAVISGIPWSWVDEQVQEATMNATNTILRPGGQFVTFVHLHGVKLKSAKRFKKLLENNFSSIERSKVVWKNLPPAFVYRCRK